MTNNYEGSHQAYDVITEHNVMTPMPDGIRLAADIFFPALDGTRAPGTFPVILERTPYNKAAAVQVTKGKYFARRGYVCVIQDVRGRFASEGEWYAFAKEADDGYATVEWLGTQPWSTGKVGTMGDSYAGSDQSALATLNPPHLATMIVAVGASNYYHSSMRHNGALEQRFSDLCLSHGGDQQGGRGRSRPENRAAASAHGKDSRDGAAVPPQGRHDPAAPPAVVRTLGSWTCSPTRITTIIGKGFRGYTPSEYYDEHADVPTLYWGGWYDSYARNTPESYVRLSAMKQVAAVPADGTLDARPVRGDALGRPRLRHRGARQLPGHETAMVRPLAEGPAQRKRRIGRRCAFSPWEPAMAAASFEGAPGGPRRLPGAYSSRRHLARRLRLATAGARATCHIFCTDDGSCYRPKEPAGGAFRAQPLHV